MLNDSNGVPYEIKDPSAVLDYIVDWTPWLTERADTIASAVFTVTAGGLAIASSGYSPMIATVWLSGGTVGTVATVRCQITTVGGRTEERSFNLRVQNK